MKEQATSSSYVPGLRDSEAGYFSAHEAKFRIVKNIVEGLAPSNILDIGAGPGAFYTVLDPNAYDIHAVEIVPEFVEKLKGMGIKAQEANIEKGSLPYPDGSFDLVICDSILEHTLRPKHLISEMSRVLKPHGHAVIVIPNATSIKRRWGHLRDRNIFEPLIENLYNRDYLLRCAVFYNWRDLTWVTREYFTLDKPIFIDEKQHDERAFTVKVGRLLSRFNPNMRDNIITIATKKS